MPKKSMVCIAFTHIKNKNYTIKIKDFHYLCIRENEKLLQISLIPLIYNALQAWFNYIYHYTF